MSSATPKEPSNPESPPSTTTNRSTQQSVAGGNPKFPIFLNIPPPLKPVTGTDDKNGVTTVDANFTAINAPNTVAAGAAKAPIKLNHQLFVTDCSNGCMPAYILSSLVGVLVVGALVSIFVTLKRRKTGRDYDQEATAINSTSSETDEPRFIAEKTNKHFTYRSSSLADIGSPNGLRRRSELGSPFAAMSELNKPFVFNKHPPHHSQNNQVLAPQRPSPAPPLVIPRSSEELYAAYTSGLVADEDTLPALGAAAVTANGDANKPPQLISPQPRSLKSIKLGEGVEEEPALLVKKDSPVTPLDFTTLLIPDPSATPTANEFEHSTLMAKKHESDSDGDLVDCWSPKQEEKPTATLKDIITDQAEQEEEEEEEDDDEDDVFFMPQVFNVDEQILPHDNDATLQQVVEKGAPQSQRSKS